MTQSALAFHARRREASGGTTQHFTRMFLRLAASTAAGNVSVAIMGVKNVNVVFERKTFFKAQAELHEWQGKRNVVVLLKYIKTYLVLNTVQQNKHNISLCFWLLLSRSVAKACSF